MRWKMITGPIIEINEEMFDRKSALGSQILNVGGNNEKGT
jgi:hypothetical protein